MSGSQGALFGIEIPMPTSDHYREQIEAWHAAGKAVSLAARTSILDQAYAIDLARFQSRPTAISGGNLALMEVLKAFGLLEDAPPPPDDPLDRFLAAVAADAGG